MFKNNYISVVLLAILAVSGCKSLPVIGAPSGLYTPPDSYPEEYKLGWKHGCKSGLSAYGNTLYKMRYNFQQDVKMMKNVLYSKAWIDSFNHCRAFTNRVLADGMWWGEGFAEDDGAVFSQGALRDVRVINDDSGFISIFDGLNLPGWGDQGWQDTDGKWGWGN